MLDNFYKQNKCINSFYSIKNSINKWNFVYAINLFLYFGSLKINFYTRYEIFNLKNLNVQLLFIKCKRLINYTFIIITEYLNKIELLKSTTQFDSRKYSDKTTTLRLINKLQLLSSLNTTDVIVVMVITHRLLAV